MACTQSLAIAPRWGSLVCLLGNPGAALRSAPGYPITPRWASLLTHAALAQLQRRLHFHARLLDEIRTQHSLRHRPEIPHEAQERHELQDVIRDVDLPPEEALARRVRIVVVVVVPAFAEREQRDDQAVAAIV